MLEAAYLIRFAAIERDGFRILAKTHERKPEIRFKSLLVEIQSDKRPADEMNEHGAGNRIDERYPYHVTRNIDL
jgi:hypothetical protein